MITTFLELPSHQTDPQHGGAARYPRLLDGLQFAVVPQLANAGGKFIEYVNGTLLSPGSATFKQTEYGYMLTNAGSAGAAVTDTAPYQFSGQMTVVALVRTATVAITRKNVAGQYSGSGLGNFSVEINRTAAKMGFAWANVLAFTGSASLSANTYYVLAWVRRGGTGAWTGEGWIDGVLDASGTTATNPNAAAATAITVGYLGPSTGDGFWNGDIGPVWMYNRPLGSGEIRTLADDIFAPLRTVPRVALPRNRRRPSLTLTGCGT